MALIIEAKAGTGVPEGVYGVEGVGAEEFIGTNNDFGPGVKLRWKVLSGPHANEEATRIVSQKLSPKSELMRFVRSILGREVLPGERIDIDAIIRGVRGTVVVETTDSGSTRVATFVREAPAAAPVAAVAPATAPATAPAANGEIVPF